MGLMNDLGYKSWIFNVLSMLVGLEDGSALHDTSDSWHPLNTSYHGFPYHCLLSDKGTRSRKDQKAKDLNLS